MFWWIPEWLYTQKMEYDVNWNLIYFWEAFPWNSSNTDKAVWRIRKMTYDVSNNLTDVEWAWGTDDFNKIYDNRTTLTYS